MDNGSPGRHNLTPSRAVRPAHVPDALPTGPFRLADARAAGLTRRQLDSAEWHRLPRDLYLHRDVTGTPSVRLAAAALVIRPDAAFSGETAAWLHGVDVRPAPDAPLEVTAPRGVTFAARSGLLLPRQSLLPDDDVMTLDGRQVTTPLRTAFDLVRLRPRVDAVVALDALLHRSLVDKDEPLEYAARHAGWRGVLQVPEIVDLSDARSESPMESRTRLLIVDGALPRPDLQYVVRDENGIFVARLDLAYPVLRIGIDYDGRVHNEDKVRIRDDRRRNRLLSVRWTPLTFAADDYYRAGGRAILTQVREAVTAARRAQAG